MRILSLIPTLPALLVLVLSVRQDSPHGDGLNISCVKCHSPKGWKVDPEVYSFNHNTTALPLTGQHTKVDCKLCHPTLVFSEAPNECALCHTDMHEQTVGNDCARCHTPNSWIVTNITDIHRQGRFPLLGPHYMAGCAACHPTASSLRFEPLGVECSDCHMADYQAARDPDHVAGNLSMECTECHSMTAFSWGGGGFSHLFFPLSGGHDIQDCSRCHTAGDFTNAPTDCFTCHQEDYNNTINPGHMGASISTDCMECHTTMSGWKPAKFTIHDAQFFPIYSGSHKGEWNRCTQCHEDLNNYANFTCLTCHEHNKSRMDSEHHEEGGYQYNSIACLECHPRGVGGD